MVLFGCVQAVPCALQTSVVQAFPSSAQAAFGTHTPPQAPFEHVKGQGEPSASQTPCGEQVWMPPWPPHFWVPGTHSPAQVPFVQMKGHCVPLVHSPFAHVWGTLLEHCFVPSVQEPPHVAEPFAKLQRNWQASVVTQAPLSLQVWAFIKEHCSVPGVQEPLHTPLPPQTKEQVVVVTHIPVSSQVCDSRPLHFLSPGVQEPLQPFLESHTKSQAVEVQAEPSFLQVWKVPLAH